jgi:hypothetical protein
MAHRRGRLAAYSAARREVTVQAGGASEVVGDDIFTALFAATASDDPDDGVL